MYIIFGIVLVEVRHMSLLCRVDLGLAVIVVGGITLAWLALVLVLVLVLVRSGLVLVSVGSGGVGVVVRIICVVVIVLGVDENCECIYRSWFGGNRFGGFGCCCCWLGFGFGYRVRGGH